MSEWEITITAKVKKTFYLEAKDEDEAEELADTKKYSELEKFGLDVDEIEECEVSEC